MVAIGFMGYGHMLLTTAYKIADISAVEPEFARLVLAAIVGWFVRGVPGLVDLDGMAR